MRNSLDYAGKTYGNGMVKGVFEDVGETMVSRIISHVRTVRQIVVIIVFVLLRS
jgi:hypothetical protein